MKPAAVPKLSGLSTAGRAELLAIWTARWVNRQPLCGAIPAIRTPGPLFGFLRLR